LPEQAYEIVNRCSLAASQLAPVPARLVRADLLDQGVDALPPEPFGRGFERVDLALARLRLEPGRNERVEQLALSRIEVVRVGLLGLEPEVEPVEQLLSPLGTGLCLLAY
jgi:hypothetical protein